MCIHTCIHTRVYARVSGGVCPHLVCFPDGGAVDDGGPTLTHLPHHLLCQPIPEAGAAAVGQPNRVVEVGAIEGGGEGEGGGEVEGTQDVVTDPDWIAHVWHAMSAMMSTMTSAVMSAIMSAMMSA